MSSYEDTKVNDKFKDCLNMMYGEYGEVVATRGNKHEYLGMDITFNENREVTIDMVDYSKDMLKEFPIKFKSEGKYIFSRRQQYV